MEHPLLVRVLTTHNETFSDWLDNLFGCCILAYLNVTVIMTSHGSCRFVGHSCIPSSQSCLSLLYFMEYFTAISYV